MNALESLKYFWPEIWLLIGAFAVLFLDLVIRNKKILGVLSLLTLGVSALASSSPPQIYPLFFGFFQLDTFTHFFRFAALGIVAVTILASLAYKPLSTPHEGEYYSLFLFMAFGLILMAASTNLLMILISIEFVSILSYLLVGFLKKDSRSKEASIKYLLFGSVASGVMLYGMSLVFGATGSLDLGVIQSQISDPQFYSLAVIATLLILVGLGFKISMAPFHLWAPDVYEGAPTSVTAFLTVGPKALGFAVLIRVLYTAFPVFINQWSPMIALLSVLTMTIGNISAIAQNNIKRLLAYSSIAQAGYILMGIATSTEIGVSAVLIYLWAYAFTNLGAFTVVMILSNQLETDDLSSYAGLSRRSPFLAASLTVFLLSLAGIPPLAGFIGKFYVFSSAIELGFINLAIAAALNSAVAAFYYFKVVRLMYLVPATSEERITHPFSLSFALLLMLAGTFAMGLAPVPFISFVKQTLLI
ncbi:MAG TPA: NADH-quinone oxidoreductase subunit N [bacterium]|nr:NADH-quinone oxidoreductase subunit N [bacterium]